MTVSDTGTRPERTPAVWLYDGAAAELWIVRDTSVTVSDTGTCPGTTEGPVSGPSEVLL